MLNRTYPEGFIMIASACMSHWVGVLVKIQL